MRRTKLYREITTYRLDNEEDWALYVCLCEHSWSKKVRKVSPAKLLRKAKKIAIEPTAYPCWAVCFADAVGMGFSYTYRSEIEKRKVNVLPFEKGVTGSRLI